MKIKIIIADDHKIVRDGLTALLEKNPDMKVVAEVDNGRQAIEAANLMQPDVVLMDVVMNGLNGIEATRSIVKHNPYVKVIGLSMYSDPEYVSGLLAAGASGYVLKECAYGEIVNAINLVMRNKSYISPEVTSVVIDGFKGSRFPAEPDHSTALTNREREIIQLIAEGYTSKEIAANLNLSIKTVCTHRQHIMDKLHCHDVAKLTKYAIRKGFTSAEV
ncbi:MAG: response regulator [Candidatus Latescibacterota bacterium]